MANTFLPEFIAFDRLFLDLDNPRHEPFDTEDQAIDYLCKSENVLGLAQDIVELGRLNPLELMAVIPDKGSGGSADDKPTYVAAEGNRRLCALKLLADPDRAPAQMRRAFEGLAETWVGAEELFCVVFDAREDVKIWLSRMHEGEQSGAGRRKWDADQTARHSGATKNRVALAVLDYATAQGLISNEDRKGTLTTVQRYLANPEVREAFGIDARNLNAIGRTKPKKQFDALLGKFLSDLSRHHVHSRANKDVHRAYAMELSAFEGGQAAAIPPVSFAASGGKAASTLRRPKPPKHKRKPHVTYEPEIAAALKKLGGSKLPSLYLSICTIRLDDHAPLIAIGVWAFIESLTERAGRTGSFPDFFSKERLQRYGLSKGRGDKAINDALRRVSNSGDATKHDGYAALFNGDQIANDMETLKDLIIKCAEDATTKP